VSTVPGIGRRGSWPVAGPAQVRVVEPTLLSRVRGIVVRMSASRASSSARRRARSDSPPSASDWTRQAMRLTRKSLFPERLDSPKTARYRSRNCAGVIRRSSASSRSIVVTI
jgi:hypothetical protein